ncbi:orotidine-5'-phosphate decarboxylase [Pseudolactococcus carnosus]|uniref:orotidine-5'-phosphate decarboxylase n=1 Tax=Pseudolactococcus carnosus TaxID=2749961 RepID=UPI0030B87F37|nr:orotidine-5'-phosphate decarboxylase [Lactococcus carnosus]
MGKFTENRPVIAMDFAGMDEVKSFLSKFEIDEQLYLKVGMELFYAAGPDIVKYMKSLGHDVFLDLKLHDIPNTVKSAMKVIRHLGVDLTNVHAAGGVDMMSEALDGLAGTTQLIAVTQLTSTSEQQMHDFQNIQSSLTDSVIHYAKKTQEAGLAGVVCSAQEVAMIKQATTSEFICLTPGIRPLGAAVGDQKRVMTPSQARAIGSDFIVVGRPITQAIDPALAYKQIKHDWTHSE